MPQARLLILLPLLLGAVACTSNPRDALPPRPEHGLANARARAAQASTPAEEATLRRSILQRCLGLGWTQEAGREYLRLTVLHHSDDDLLRELCLATLRWALRDVDPARRVSALRVAGEARELPSGERLALAEIGARDRRAEVRVAAQRVLASLRDERSAGLLSLALADDDARVRFAALEGLLSRGTQVEDLLLKACHDPAQRVRVHASEVLGQRPLSERAREALARLVRHADPVTARAAALGWAQQSPQAALAAWQATKPRALADVAVLHALSYRAGGSSAPILQLLSERPPASVCLVALAALRGAPGQGLSDFRRLSDSGRLVRPLVALVVEHPAPSVVAASLELLRALEAHPSRLERALTAQLSSPDLARRRLALTWARRIPRGELLALLRDPGLADLAAARLEGLLPREEWREQIVAALDGPARETLLPRALGLEGGRARAHALLASPTRGRLRSLGLQSLLGNTVGEDLNLLLPHLTQDQDEDLYAAVLTLAVLRQNRGKTANLPQ